MHLFISNWIIASLLANGNDLLKHAAFVSSALQDKYVQNSAVEDEGLALNFGALGCGLTHQQLALFKGSGMEAQHNGGAGMDWYIMLCRADGTGEAGVKQSRPPALPLPGDPLSALACVDDAATEG